MANHNKLIQKSKDQTAIISLVTRTELKQAVLALEPTSTHKKLQCFFNNSQQNQMVILRQLLSDLKTISTDQNMSVFVSVLAILLEYKPARQISCRIISSLAVNSPQGFDSVIKNRQFMTFNDMLHLFLYCPQTVLHIQPSTLQGVWSGYFSQEVYKDELLFMFSCRALNALLSVLEKSERREMILDSSTINRVFSLLYDDRVNKDTRQVLGLIYLSLSTFSCCSVLAGFRVLFEENKAQGSTSVLVEQKDDTTLEHLQNDPFFAQFALVSALISRMKDLDDRGVLYEVALDKLMDLAQCNNFDKLFTILIFKCLSSFISTLLMFAMEEEVNLYPEEEDRLDPLKLDKAMLAPDTKLTNGLLNLCKVHWGNKLEAVRRCVGDIHSNLTQLVLTLCGEENGKSFLNRQVDELLSLEWSIHGKYNSLSQLVTLVGTEKMLQTQPNLPTSLLKVMKHASLSGQSATLYCTLYKYDRSPECNQTWIQPLAEHIHHPLIADYCLKTILANAPEALDYLIKLLMRRHDMEGVVRAVREGRRIGYLDYRFVDEADWFTEQQDDLFDIPISTLKKQSISCDDGKVLSVMSLLCDTNKSALPLSVTEMDLILYILKRNEVRQSPAFRKGVLDNFNKFLTRLTKSAPFLRRTTALHITDDERLLASAASDLITHYNAFVERCLDECFSQLYPSASFQRQVTVMGVLGVFFKHSSNVIKVNVTDEQQNKLLSALGSTFETVRSAALECLATIPQFSLTLLQSKLSQVLSGLTSPRGINTMTNTALFHFVFQYSIGKQPGMKRTHHKILVSHSGLTPAEILTTTKSEYTTLFSGGDGGHIYSWLQGVFAVIDNQVMVADSSIMLAAQQAPIFPVLHLMEIILRHGEISNKLNTSEQSSVITYMMALTTKLTALLEEPITDESPEGLLLMGSLDAGPCGTQLLMSMAWRVMQSLCNCLVLLLGDSKTPSIASKAVQEEIGVYLRDLLMRVRHNGVFENVHSAFISYCHIMWGREQDLMTKWLDEILVSIEQGKDDMTYTRRSAGIPCLIQALVVSEPTRNGKPFLRDTLTRLLEIAESGADTTPKIHSLNVLQVLFKDSKLSEFIVPYIGQGFEMSVRGFSNNAWSLRNSSTLLFSALMLRMFNMKQSNVRRTTASTFFTLFPNLHPFFLEELRGAIECGQGNRLYHPSLYPILLILQRLQPCPVQDETKLSLRTFVPLITHLAHSGVMKTRALAAETLSYITPTAELQATILSTIKTLQRTDNNKQNSLHGKLLQIHYMIDIACTNDEEQEDSVSSEGSDTDSTTTSSALADTISKGPILSALLSSPWLLLANPCSMTAALYLDIVTSVMGEASDSSLQPLLSFCSSVVQRDPAQGPVATLKKSCVTFILASRSMQYIAPLMAHPNPALNDHTFQYLASCDLEEWCSDAIPYQGTTLVEMVTSASSTSLYEVELRLMMAMPLDKAKVYDRCIKILKEQRVPRLQVQAVRILTALPMWGSTEGFLIPNGLHPDTLLPHLLPLCSPLNPYEVRAALPACLKKCYYGIIGGDQAAVCSRSKAMLCLTTLLQDEDEDVRQSASTAILSVIDPYLADISPEVTLHLLIKFIRQQNNDWWYLELIQWIYQSEVQELTTTHYSERYKSEGYANTSRTSSPDSEDHPLFESDVINAFAEPLLIPFTIARNLLQREVAVTVEDVRLEVGDSEDSDEEVKQVKEHKDSEEKSEITSVKPEVLAKFKELSAELYNELSYSANIPDSSVKSDISPQFVCSKRSLQRYIASSKTRMIALSMVRVGEIWGVTLDQDWAKLSV